MTVDVPLMAPLQSWKAGADKTRYQMRHIGLAVGLGSAMRLLRRAFLSSQAPPRSEDPSAFIQRFRGLLEEDWANAEAGYYPRELLFQFPFATYLRRLPEQLADLPKLAARRRSNRWRDLPTDVDVSRYPRYYRRNFHWQTDGWFSAHSARIYDQEVELLFVGTADIMRRMAIPPVVDAVRGIASPRILDVGCGTGRFLSQLASALPTARLTGLDLSPFYIKEASRNLASALEASLLVDDASNIPLRDSTQDAVTSVFMFHELPRAVRRDVLREMVRVVRPGGTIVIEDSAQLSDSEFMRPILEDFARVYHEPFYLDYIQDDLETLMADAGLHVRSSRTHTVSKVVVATTPAA